jgi:thioredoxin-related protein
MKRLMLWTMLMPLLASAQMQIANKGIQWTTDLSWEQVKRKAKQENKYIFVDCYATWCGPCKQMDKETYPNEKVGELVNEKFIAVKLQMDSTKNDSEPIQNWYPVVNEIKTKYAIPGYPTFLFFSPDGELVHQDVGYKPVKDFVVLVNDALDPANQLASIMGQYKAGNLSPVSLGKAALAEKKLGKKELSDSIARQYKAEYLDKLDDATLFTKDNIQFVTKEFYFLYYEEGSKGRFFKFFYGNPQKVDSLFEKGFAESYVEFIITKEELVEKLFKNNKAVTETPDWKTITQNIALKYGNKYAEDVVAANQQWFYWKVGNYKKWAELFEAQMKKTPPQKGGKNLGGWSDQFILNAYAWNVFQVCNDRSVLLKALKWSELSIKLNKPEVNEQYLDTKANLLYKLGRRIEAIKTEKKALQVDTENAKKQGKDKGLFFDEFSGNIKKMEAGIPIWKVM